MKLGFIVAITDKLPESMKRALIEKPFSPQPSVFLADGSVMEQVKKKDVLLSYPYESMDPFLQLIKEAAYDPDVMTIKITIYRLAKKARLVEYLCAAAENGKEVTVFTPLAPYETPPAVAAICEQFGLAVAAGDVDPLILIPVFIHDFLCIHPFSDGNGRMSRLLTALLLYRCGFLVGKYVSLEAKIAKTKDLYYDALSAAQAGWHEGKDDPTAFIKYLLGTVVAAYRDLEDRMELVSEKLPAFGMVQKAVRGMVGKFTKVQVLERCPSLSASSVEASLKKLVAGGELAKHGAGRSTFYVRIS